VSEQTKVVRFQRGLIRNGTANELRGITSEGPLPDLPSDLQAA
jgi:hypothetical protein